MKRLRRLMHALRLAPVLLKRAIVKAWQDRVLGLSAEAAFWQMLSLPSLFLALIASLGYGARWFGDATVDRAEVKLEDALSHAFTPDVVHNVITPTLNEVLRGGRADVISIGFVLALWAGSSATATFVNTITIAYDQRDLRGPIRSRFLALGLFLGSVALGVLLLPMLVLGPDLLRRAFPNSVRGAVSHLIEIGYYPVLVVLLLLGLATFYRLAPPRRLPWLRGLPGAILAVLVFLGGSVGLRAYIGFVLDKNHAYAALAAPIAALLFFYVLALGVLLGAEFNAAIETYKPAPTRAPSVLDPRTWQRFQSASDAGPDNAAPHNGDHDGAGSAPSNGGRAPDRSGTRDGQHSDQPSPRIRP